MNIDEICKIYDIENYTINNGSIDVDGDVYIQDKNLDKIPLKFNKVSGSFSCSCNNLDTLEYCPEYVGKDFWCYNNNTIDKYNDILSCELLGEFFSNTK